MAVNVLILRPISFSCVNKFSFILNSSSNILKQEIIFLYNI